MLSPMQLRTLEPHVSLSLEVEVNLDMRIADERRELQECTSLLHGKMTIDKQLINTAVED